MPALGSNINAALGRIDYSPIARGGESLARGIAQAGQVKGQTYASIGQNISQGIQKYQKNQLEKKEQEGARNMLEKALADPRLAKALNLSPGDDNVYDKGELNAAIEGAGGRQNLSAWLNQGQQMVAQQEQQIADNAHRKRALDASITNAATGFSLEDRSVANAEAKLTTELAGMRANTDRTIAETKAIKNPRPSTATDYERKFERAVKAAEQRKGSPLDAVEIAVIDEDLMRAMNPSEQSYFSTGGGIAATRDDKEFNDARVAVEKYAKIQETMDLIKNGDANLGFLSDLRTDADRVLATLFGDKEALQSVTDTELINSLTGSTVFGLLQELGIGARGLDTPAEVQFLRQVMTGDTAMTRDALLGLLELSAEKSRNAVNGWNQRSETGSNQPFYEIKGNQGLQRRFVLPEIITSGAQLSETAKKYLPPSR
jgi:hypothetical protein